jgi:hypothetical protein
MIRNQIAHRVMTDDGIDPRVFDAYGIDPSAKAEGETPLAYPHLDDVKPDDEVYRGVVPFEVQVGVLGRTHTFDCRAIYTATLTDDGSIEALCADVLGECEVTYQLLTWEPKSPFGKGCDRLPLPRWVPLDPGTLFPRELRLLVLALIENDAIRQQESDS